MPIIVKQDEADQVVTRTINRMKRREREQAKAPPDVVTHAENTFYIPSTGKPVVLEDFQKAVMLYAFPKLQEGFRFSLVVFSTVKKTGKTAMAAMVGRWVAEVRSRYGEVFTMGNDARQARERSFAQIQDSIKLTPGYRNKGLEGTLPDEWIVQQQKMECLTSGTRIEAVAVDARGEAGSNHDLTIWTELWGFESEDARKFFEEMTPVPTKPSCRLIETYAGFDGESDLLRSIYEDAHENGRQLTAGELAEDTGIPIGCFEEAQEPDDLVPIWVNEKEGFFCWWDDGEDARRMPWQRGEQGQRYYIEQAKHLPLPQMIRLHSNKWVGGESDFIPMSQWDACQEELPDFNPGDPMPTVLSADAAVSGDCFGIVLVTRHPEPERHETDVAIRRTRLWTPPKGGSIDLEGPEGFIRAITQGGCAAGHPQKAPWYDPQSCDACKQGILIKPYNIIEVTYDPFQLESMMQKLYKEGINCQPFSQTQDRQKADSMLYDLIMQKRLAHRGNAELRQHVQNAAAKMQKDEDSKLRIVKKESGRKIDLTVAMSMGCYRSLYFML